MVDCGHWAQPDINCAELMNINNESNIPILIEMQSSEQVKKSNFVGFLPGPSGPFSTI